MDHARNALIAGGSFVEHSIRAWFAGAILGFLSLAAPAGAWADPASEPYSVSFAPGGRDEQGHFLGGTELLNLVPYQGKLYAGVGYWLDKPDFFPDSPDPASGPQILVLDSKNGHWRQEVAFPQRNASTGKYLYRRPSTMGVVEFHMDGAGNKLNPPVQMLVAGVDGLYGGVYTQKAPGVWEDTSYPFSTPLRAFAVRIDPASGVEKLYVGAGRGETGIREGAIYSAVFDPATPGRLRWNPQPEFAGFPNRVLSMAECDKQLFFSAKPSIFVQKAGSGAWSSFYDHTLTGFDASKYASGFRALTCIADPARPDERSLLTAFEGRPGQIMRFDFHDGKAVTELVVQDFVRSVLGEDWFYDTRPGGDFITAYTDMPLVQSSSGAVRLLGLLAGRRVASCKSVFFLSRAENESRPAYRLHEVASLPSPYQRSDSDLWSVRTIAVSPFPEDEGKVLYLGGYDGHFRPDHNTAWMYRVGVDVALRPAKPSCLFPPAGKDQ